MATDQTATKPENRSGARKARVPLDERREDVIEAALVEFGRGGFEGASTSAIAERAGIQQPYIYAMFENKRELFLACNDELNERLLASFRAAAETGGSPSERLRRMSAAYRDLLENEPWARCHLQMLASAGRTELRRPVRKGFDRVFAEVCELTGASGPEVARFFAGNVMATAMNVIGEPAEMIDQLCLPGDGDRDPASLAAREASLRN